MNIDERFLDDQPFDTAQAKDYISGYLGRINSGAENSLNELSDRLEAGTQATNNVSATELLALTKATEKSSELIGKVDSLTDVQLRYVEETIRDPRNFYFDRWGYATNEASGDPVGACSRAEEAFEYALSTPEDALIREMNNNTVAALGLARVQDRTLPPDTAALAGRIIGGHDPLKVVARRNTVAALLSQPNPAP